MAASLVFGLLYVAGLTSAVAPVNIQSYLKSHLSSKSDVFLSGSQSYKTELTERWNAYLAPSYIVHVKPATAQDVSTVVSFSERFAYDENNADDQRAGQICDEE